MHAAHPLANGLSTHHPVAGLAFVDDTHLPLDDGRLKEAALRTGDAHSQPDGQWWAYLPDPARPELSWCIRHHPEHGRSVLLHPTTHAPTVLRAWWGEPLLHRAGGYWWDGTAWYRPGRTWNPERAAYQPQPVPSATTVTAAHHDAGAGNAARAHLLRITDLATDEPARTSRWTDDLALWSTRHTQTSDRPLVACVITVQAPELETSQLLGVSAVAATAGISPSTLRAYISRGDCDVPPPQAVVGRRSLWARPVAEEWAEQRRAAVDGPIAAIPDTIGLSSGAAQAQHDFARVFFDQLWHRPEVRKRWTSRHRTAADVRQVADELGRTVAARLDDILPVDAVAGTLTAALLDALTGRARTGQDRPASVDPSSAAMLCWLDRHHPDLARQVITDTARRRRGIAPARTEQLLRGLLDDHRGNTPGAPASAA
ncbi:helix-turn-helix transcriptional regulator [Streptomyces sp. NPDC014983]|uniref:helix-turn-helix transcriptional regulator n=1 Tax=Streptomyces sp. NPDC014983 TaxID=3364933 RepID=UPI0036F63A9D